MRWSLIFSLVALAVLTVYPADAFAWGHRGGGCSSCGNACGSCSSGGGGGCNACGGMVMMGGGCQSCNMGGAQMGGCQSCNMGSGCQTCYYMPASSSTCTSGCCTSNDCGMASCPQCAAAPSVHNPSIARLFIHLPDTAALKIDGQQTQATSSGRQLRSFKTPTLDPGFTYTYTLTAQDRDGTSWQRKIAIQAGETRVIELQSPTVMAKKKLVDDGQVAWVKAPSDVKLAGR